MDRDADSLSDSDWLNESDAVVVSEGVREGVPDLREMDSDSVSVGVRDNVIDGELDDVKVVVRLRLLLILRLTDSDFERSSVTLVDKVDVCDDECDVVSE